VIGRARGIAQAPPGYTGGMTPKKLHDLCLSFDGAVETFPFSAGTSVFKAADGKVFAIAALEEKPLAVSVKCDPERAMDLRGDHDSIRPGYHLNKRHWITVTSGGDASDGLLRELVEDSFDLVA
jgi:predicted DNA-binding protein (MmcQ/YjbR family)